MSLRSLPTKTIMKISLARKDADTKIAKIVTGKDASLIDTYGRSACLNTRDASPNAAKKVGKENCLIAIIAFPIATAGVKILYVTENYPRRIVKMNDTKKTNSLTSPLSSLSPTTV